jgi:hypothetical protein
MKKFILFIVLFFTLVGCNNNLIVNKKTAEVEVSSESSTSNLDSELFKIKGQIVVAGLCGANLSLPGGKVSNCSNGVLADVIVMSKSGEKVVEMQPDTKSGVVFTLPAGEYTIIVPETLITEKKEFPLNVTGEKNITLNLQSKLPVR